MTDHLANSWESTVGSVVEGDPVVALSWLHNGVKLALHVEKVCPVVVTAEGVGSPFRVPLHSLCGLGGNFCSQKGKSDSQLNFSGGWMSISSSLSAPIALPVKWRKKASICLPVIIQKKGI